MEPLTANYFPRQRRPTCEDRGARAYLRPCSTQVKIIDFGNGTYSHDYHGRVIATRGYRAPEVLLNSGWNEAVDVWAFGCILAELYSGRCLFRPRDDTEYLAMLERWHGRALPQEMLEAASKRVQTQSLSNYRGSWLVRAPSPSPRMQEQRSIREIVEPSHSQFASFLDHLLILDYSQRPSTVQCLRHDFFTVRYDD